VHGRGRSAVPTLTYIHDPMCSWCWGFSPCLDRLLASLPQKMQVRRLLGGLAPDSDEPMPEATRAYVQGQWRRIQREVPGTRFNFDFWKGCAPRRSTWPACRAVIAARFQDEVFDPLMTRAIQRAYYVEARNPSDTGTLIELAGELGLDTTAFECALTSEAVDAALMAEIAETRALGARGFPSLLLTGIGDPRWISIDYLDEQTMLAEITDAGRGDAGGSR
jgi:putative protein-disulfide isomerase